MHTPAVFIRQIQHALAVLALGASSLVCAAPSTTDITVVQVAPLSGVLASTGKQMVLGGKIYFDWVNAQGGINGAKIKHTVVDDGYKVDETVRLTREALQDPDVIALFGFAGTANVSKLLSDGVLAAKHIGFQSDSPSQKQFRPEFYPPAYKSFYRLSFHLRDTFSDFPRYAF